MRAESRPTSHIGRSLHKNNSLSVIFGTFPPPHLTRAALGALGLDFSSLGDHFLDHSDEN